MEKEWQPQDSRIGTAKKRRTRLLRKTWQSIASEAVAFDRSSPLAKQTDVRPGALPSLPQTTPHSSEMNEFAATIYR